MADKSPYEPPRLTTESVVSADRMWRTVTSPRVLLPLAFAYTLATAISTTAAHATNCDPQIASRDLRYSARGSDQGIVSTGFVVPAGTNVVVHGIDASKYQEAIDFDGVRDCGGTFAYIRLSAGASADNELAYRTLWANAKFANLLTGPYHTLTLIGSKKPINSPRREDISGFLDPNIAHARDQARLFVARLVEVLGYDPVAQQPSGSYGAPYLPAVLALSAAPVPNGSIDDRARYGRVYGTMACAWIDEFRSDPHFRDQPVILFTTPFIYKDYSLFSAPCDLTSANIWISYFGQTGDSATTESEPTYRAAIDQLCQSSRSNSNRCIFEQYTSFGAFAAYKAGGGLDLDRYYGSLESLRSLLQHAVRQPSD